MRCPLAALAAALAIFAANLIVGSLVGITLPSLVVPFGGHGVGLVRGFLWGTIFAPLGGFEPRLLVSLPVLLLEGEGYVMAMLGVWLWWWPVVRNGGHRWLAWRSGLRLQTHVYVGVACLLALAAAYESLAVVYLLSR